MDSAPGHKTELVKQVCKKHNFDVAMIPGGMTKDLQPLDISVNRSFKTKLKERYTRALMQQDDMVIERGQASRVKRDRVVDDIWHAAGSIDKDTTRMVSGKCSRILECLVIDLYLNKTRMKKGDY